MQQRRGDLDAAIANLRRAIALEPGFADGHYNLGNALVAQGEREAAFASYRRAIAIDPNHVRAHLNLGNTLPARRAGQARRWSTSGGSWRSIPPTPAAYTGIAAICWSRGRLEEAADALRRSLALDPGQPKAHSDLIYLLTYNGLASEAEILEECRRFERQHAAKPAER